MGVTDDTAAGQVGGLLVGAGSVIVLRTDVGATAVDDLAVGLFPSLAGEDLADDKGAGDGRRNDVLLLQAHMHEVGDGLFGAQAGGDVDAFTRPFDGDVGHVSLPFRWR